MVQKRPLVNRISRKPNPYAIGIGTLKISIKIPLKFNDIYIMYAILKNNNSPPVCR